MPEQFRGQEGRRRLVEQLAKQELVQKKLAIAEQLAKVAKLEEYKEGQEVYHEGTPANHKLYFILSGKFDLLVKGSPVTVKEKGQAVGEFPVVDSSLSYTVTVKARVSSIVATIREDQYLSIAMQYPEIWKNMAEMLVKRLHATTEGLCRSPKAPACSSGMGDPPFGRT